MGDSLINSVNETIQNEVGKKSPEGMMVAYTSLTIMALLPILFGSYRSVSHHKQQKESGEATDTMTRKDVALFPLIASAALLGLYVIFKIFSQEYVNLLLTGYFFFLGIFSLSHILSPFIKFIDSYLPQETYHFKFGKMKNDSYSELAAFVLYYSSVASLAISFLFCLWYFIQKHWIANNLLGLAFSVNGIELLQLNSILNGCILLGGLFIYDIFWVFGTDVMVTVAKSFEAPIKLVFPQDILQYGLKASNFAILGLGDIVIPGIFIALLLRFDTSLKRKVPVYFISGFFAYLLGLIMTIVVMYTYNHAQPALLYLVPSCLGFPLSLAFLKGDLALMFQYKDMEEKPKDSHDDKSEEQSAENNISKNKSE